MKLLELEHITVAYDDRTVLNDVNLTINRGDFMTVTGPNGGGKTTLLRVMLRLLKPNSGKVVCFNEEGKKVKYLRTGYLPQKNYIDVNFPITTGEVVESGLLKGAFGGISKNDSRKFDEVCEEMGITSFLSRRIGALSGGQLQRTLLGRAVISDPEFLVLDEPLSYVDKQFEKQIFSIMQRLSERMTIVLVSHELSMISKLATRHIVVDNGIWECGATHHANYHACED